MYTRQTVHHWALSPKLFLLLVLRESLTKWLRLSLNYVCSPSVSWTSDHLISSVVAAIIYKHIKVKQIAATSIKKFGAKWWFNFLGNKGRWSYWIRYLLKKVYKITPEIKGQKQKLGMQPMLWFHSSPGRVVELEWLLCIIEHVI